MCLRNQNDTGAAAAGGTEATTQHQRRELLPWGTDGNEPERLAVIVGEVIRRLGVALYAFMDSGALVSTCTE